MHTADLAPDDYLLGQIFPHSIRVTIEILAQSWIECTSLVDVFDQDQPSQKFILHLRLPQEGNLNLRAMSAMSSIAALAIPELVPEIKKVGITQTEDSRPVEFSITEYIPGSRTLEAVWYGISSEQQKLLVEAVIEAMRKLQNLSIANERVQKILHEASISTQAEGGVMQNSLVVAGSLELGFHDSITSLLSSILTPLNKRIQTSTLTSSSDGGIIISSGHADISSIQLPPHTLSALHASIVFCHNNLEPRNILVRFSPSGYHLVAIIDWGKSGFVPFGYEYVLKDSLLGRENQCFGWYTLFKQLAFDLLPQGPEGFMRAVDLAHESCMRGMTRDVGVAVRKKWIEREGLVRNEEVWRGWKRRVEREMKDREEDNKVLVQEVLKELGLI